MLLKYFHLHRLIVSLKHIENIEGNGAVVIVIPYLGQINAGVPVKEWGVWVKALSLLKYLVSIPYLEVDVPSGLYQRVHLLKGCEHVFVAHIGQRIAGAGNAVEEAVEML